MRLSYFLNNTFSRVPINPHNPWIAQVLYNVIKGFYTAHPWNCGNLSRQLQECVAVWLSYIRNMSQFHVLDLIYSLNDIHHRTQSGGDNTGIPWLWADIDRNCNPFLRRGRKRIGLLMSWPRRPGQDYSPSAPSYSLHWKKVTFNLSICRAALGPLTLTDGLDDSVKWSWE